MSDGNAFLVDAEMRLIGPEGAPYPAEGIWAEPDVEQAAALMRRVVDNPAEARRRGVQAERDMAARYSAAAAGATMTARLDALEVRRPRALRARIVAAQLGRNRRASTGGTGSGM